jgi:hypothetical protein
MGGKVIGYLDVMRGPLPLVLATSPQRGSGLALVRLFATGILHGLVVGAELGAITGVMIGVASGVPQLALVGAAYGAVAGTLVAVPLSCVIAATIAVVAATAHRPLREPRRLHRQIWAVFLIYVGALDVGAALTLARDGSTTGVLIFSALTAVLLLLLKRPGRRLVLAYARASGWIQGSGLSP